VLEEFESEGKKEKKERTSLRRVIGEMREAEEVGEMARDEEQRRRREREGLRISGEPFQLN